MEGYIASFGESLNAKVSFTDKKALQNINENFPILDNQESDTLQSIIARLLWLEKIGRP